MTKKEKLIEVLRQRLVNNGFEPHSRTAGEKPTVYKKSKNWPNSEIIITFYPDHFEAYYREYPAKEGWEIKDHKYTEENVNQKWYWL